MKWSILLLPLSSLQAAALYNVVALGGFGGNTSVAAAVNASGVVAATSTTVRGSSVAFTGAGSSPFVLGTSAEARAINDTGTVVGTVYTGGSPTATVWKDGVANQVLGYESYGLGINNAGDVAGARRMGSTLTGFVTTADGLMDVPAGGQWSSANDISNTGLIAGTLENSVGQFRAFSWNRADASVREVGTLGGENSYGMAASDAGFIAGSSQTAAGYLHAFLYDGTLQDLGTLGGNNSAAYDVNSAGQVVGYSFDKFGRSRAFLWFDGTMLDLNDVLDSGSGWRLDAAYGISETGQIVGSGFWNGQATAFRLDPLEDAAPVQRSLNPLAEASVPEPTTMALSAFGGFGLLLLRFRRLQRQPKGWS